MSNKSPVQEPYKVPVPFRGQIVLWYPNGCRNEESACPAIVKVNGHSSVHLKVFTIDREVDYTCVRHMDDPNAREYDRIEGGGWDFANLPAKPAAFTPAIKDPLRGDTQLTPTLEDATAL